MAKQNPLAPKSPRAKATKRPMSAMAPKRSETSVQSEKKIKTSPDYSFLGREVLRAAQGGAADSPLQANREEAFCKPLPYALAPALYVVATPIGNLGDITLRALVTLAATDVVYCEDTRVTGGLLTRYGIKKQLVSCHDHNEAARLAEILGRLTVGQAVVLVSDAGTPLISDPGYKIAHGVRAAGFAVTAVPGASALLTALCGAGLPTDRFMFEGFLPAKTGARRTTIQNLAGVQGSLIFYESPHRAAETLADLADLLGAGRSAAMARELTKLFEETRVGRLGDVAAQAAAEPPRGEVVILVGPPDPDQAAAAVDLDGLLLAALDTASLRDAVAQVVAQTGFKKSVVYDRALALQKKEI